MGTNPLGVSQRENKGAETFGKYEYQYHWALCRIIEEHKKNGSDLDELKELSID